MIIHSISSGSVGNCYALEVNNKFLLLDCGIAYAEIAKALNFKMSSVIGCLLTHEHGDHMKGAPELIRRGIKVYSSLGTSTKVKGCRIVQNKTEFSIGEFKVMPFDVPHDAAEPFGYLINHDSIGNLAFITDAMYCKYKFPNLRHAMVEANYSEEYMTTSLEFLRDRIKQSHMSIETCCDFIKINSETLETVTLLHLSDSNSNQDEFQKKIMQISGVRVYVAEKNTKINLCI